MPTPWCAFSKAISGRRLLTRHYRVMPFKLTNVPAVFQVLVNNVLHDIGGLSEEAEAAFRELKLLSVPTLSHPDLGSQLIVEVETSEVRVGAVLSQLDALDQKLHPCAFFSWRLSLAEANYDIGNRELLAVVLVLQESLLSERITKTWSTKRLNSRQVRWTPFLGFFKFSLTYHPG